MKTKRKSSVIFILCTLAILLFAFLGFNGAEVAKWRIKPFSEVITKGLDLQGGVSVVMEIQDEEVSKEDLEKTKDQLALRVNKIGVAETVVATEGNRRIRVDIPGEVNSGDIVNSLGKTGELTFKSPDGEVILSGQDVNKAAAVTNSQTREPEVSIEMNSEGTKKFADATEKYLGQSISIYMDDELLMSPTVNTVITEGKASITGNKSASEAKRLAGLINAGALPVTVKAVSVQTVGAQLGAEALPNAMKAALIGVGLIFIFMILNYRIPGAIASLALIFFICIVLFIFGEIDATLTLPGIAGFLLTIGMAVDANVLIFERIREELRKGMSIKSSVEKGFENALSSIVDSNVTTILAALVLYFFGSGIVKGFAITLLIGVLVSLFTALTVTKFFMKRAVNMGLLSKPSHFRVNNGLDKNLKIVEKKKIWFAVSIVIILIGIGTIAFKGLNFGIDFQGGTRVVVEFTGDFDKVDVDNIVKDYASDAVTNTIEEKQYEIKSKDLDSQKVSDLINELKGKYQMSENPIVSQDEIGASVGNDLKKKSLMALAIAFVAMLIYIAIRFEFKFGVVALLSLFHDLLITISVFAVLGLSINTPFIAAILTIIGYSINATIVIFDRIRENLKLSRRETPTEIANKSVTQTMARTINTTLTTLFTIVAVFIFVPTVREFSLPIIIGIVSGVFSSVCIAPSLWVLVAERKKK